MSRRSDRRRQALAAGLWREEQVWRNATRCSELLAVRTGLSQRKHRLFAVELCRSVLHLCPEPWHCEAVEQSAKLAESAKPGMWCEGISGLDLARLWRRRWSEWLNWTPRPNPRAVPQSPEQVGAERAIIDLATWSEGSETCVYVLTDVLRALAPGEDSAAVSAREEYDTGFADLLREIAGDPFALNPLDPSWRTSTAVCLARTIDDGADYSLLPILADALQDAGCEDEGILSHCRGEGPHVRGCWVIDLVLGKASG